jgi:hypothetical protein
MGIDDSPDGATANLLLVPELQAAIVEAMPGIFSPVPGDLHRVDEAALERVLREAHALASEPPKRSAKKVGAKRTRKPRATK